MGIMLEQGIDLQRRGELKLATQEQLEYLAEFTGEGAIAFLQQQQLEVFYTEHSTNYFGEIQTYYFESHGRTVEMMRKSRKHTGRDALEIHFSMTPDLVTLDEDRYGKKPEDDTQGLEFLSFMKQFLSTFRKDASLRIKASDQRKKALFEAVLKKMGFTYLELM